MRFWKPNRRWLQFSVRGLLLLTLAVALWLGYEVWEARRVERATAAIRALGGEVEWAPGGWSLVKFIVGEPYGQRIFAAEIPGEALGDAIELLASLPGLSEVRVIYDGSDGIWQNWDRLNAALPGRTIIATTQKSLVLDYEELNNGTSGRIPRQAAERVSEQLKRGSAKVRAMVAWWESASSSPVAFRIDYHLLRHSDGTWLEVLVVTETMIVGSRGPGGFAILLTSGNAIDCAEISGPSWPAPRLEDLDGDGYPELCFECFLDPFSDTHDERARQLPGDARYWLDVYKIDPDGFHSILPAAPETAEPRVRGA